MRSRPHSVMKKMRSVNEMSAIIATESHMKKLFPDEVIENSTKRIRLFPLATLIWFGIYVWRLGNDI